MELFARTLHGLPNQIGATLSLSNQFMDAWGVDLNIIRLARFIVSGTNGAAEEAESVRRWVRQEIEYRNDPSGHELIQDPIVTLHERAGDCDDMTILAGCLLRAVGHDCEAAAITWAGNDYPTHAVLLDHQAGVVVDAVSSVHIHDWPPHPYVVSGIERGK